MEFEREIMAKDVYKKWADIAWLGMIFNGIKLSGAFLIQFLPGVVYNLTFLIGFIGIVANLFMAHLDSATEASTLCRENVEHETFTGPFLYYCPTFIFTLLSVTCCCFVVMIATGQGGELEKMFEKE